MLTFFVGGGVFLGSETAAAESLVYVNFDGARLTAPAVGTPEHAAKRQAELVARLNIAELNIPALQFPPEYPRELAIATILADVEQHYQGVGLRMVTEPPIDDRYTMIVVGGSAEAVGLEREFGWGPTDCGDQNLRNVAFVFADTIIAANGNFDTTRIAATISQELAHAFGLEHVDGPDDLLMRPIPAQVERYRFSRECYPIIAGPAVGPQGPGCGTTPGCPADHQRDWTVLENALGIVEAGDQTGGESTNTDLTTGTGSSGDVTNTDPNSTDTTATHDPGAMTESRGCAVTPSPMSAWPLGLLGFVFASKRRRTRCFRSAKS